MSRGFLHEKFTKVRTSSKNIMGSLLRMVYANPSMTVITWKLQVQKKYSKSLVSVFVVKKTKVTCQG
jgi:hypothetical protein